MHDASLLVWGHLSVPWKSWVQWLEEGGLSFRCFIIIILMHSLTLKHPPEVTEVTSGLTLSFSF